MVADGCRGFVVLRVFPCTLRHWIKKYLVAGLKTRGRYSVRELNSEVSQLCKELAEARREKDVSKNAPFGSFGKRRSGFGTRTFLMPESGGHLFDVLDPVCDTFEQSICSVTIITTKV